MQQTLVIFDALGQQAFAIGVDDSALVVLVLPHSELAAALNFDHKRRRP